MNTSADVTESIAATKCAKSPETVPISRSGDDREPFSPYSRTTTLSLLSALLFAVLVTSHLVPPLQSPDEFAHIGRAYLLSRGTVLLETKDGMTGGYIDTGVLKYMGAFPLATKYHQKATKQMLRDASGISFTNEHLFSPIPNTALYFPLIYTPQALAFTVGRQLSLEVNETYYLARTFSLTVAIALLWAALRLYPIPLPVLALFAMPMVIFQLGAASLDGVSFALSALAGALYARTVERPILHSPLTHAALVISLTLLAVSRTHLVGMVWTPLTLHLTHRRTMYATWTGISVILSVMWIFYITFTVRGFQSQDMAPFEILLYYLSRPDELYSVIISTLTNGPLLSSYWRMFIGILGWLDTPLDHATYVALTIMLAALALLSLRTDRETLFRRPNRALLAGVAISISLLFALFLVTGTLHPAKFIGGIQGRYFYHVAIFMGFSLFRRPLSSATEKAGFAILFLIMTISVLSIIPKLLGRYWLSL